MYIKEKDDGSFIYPYTIEQLRAECGKLLPKNMTKAQLESLGVYTPNFEPVDFDSKTQKVVQLSPEKINGAWVVKSVVTDKTADDYERENLIRQRAKESEIRKAFEAAASADVTGSQGIAWRGGLQSAQSIAGAVDLAQVAGLAEITLRDASRKPHIVDMATGLQVAAEIAMAYQAAFQKKEDLMLQVESIDLKQAAAETEINSIAWGN